MSMSGERMPHTLTRRTALSIGGAMLLVSRPSLAAPMKIATIGAGKMGAPLGKLWVNAGHQVMFSSRRPETLTSVVEAAGKNARAGTVAEAVAFGDVIVLLVPYSAMPDLAREHGKALAAKPLVIDVSNPFPQRDGAPGEEARAKGAGVYLRELMPGVKIVRAFNAINYRRLEEAAAKTSDRVGVPIAGDDAGAMKLAADLINDIGFEAVPVGDLKFGRHLIPGTPLAGERTAAEVKKVAATLE